MTTWPPSSSSPTAIATKSQLANTAALIGRAGAARRLGDLDSCRRWLDEAKANYESVGLPGGSTPALIGLVWWSLAVGDLTEADEYAEQARSRAAEAADPLVGILADTVVAAVALASSDTEANRNRFTAVLERRAAAGRSTAFFEATLDDPDVEALAAAHGLRSRLISAPPQRARQARGSTWQPWSTPVVRHPSHPDDQAGAGPAVEDHGRAVTANRAGGGVVPAGAAGRRPSRSHRRTAPRRHRRSGLRARHRRSRRHHRNDDPQVPSAADR